MNYVMDVKKQKAVVFIDGSNCIGLTRDKTFVRM